MCLSLAVAGVFAAGSESRADTTLNIPVNTTDLATTSPTPTSDLTFINGSYVSPSAFVVSSNISTGTLDDLDTLQSLTVTNGGGGGIILDSLSNATPGAQPADLLYVSSGSSLTVNAPIGLGAAGGNFDIAGTAAIGGVISDGGSAFGFTKTGAGILTLDGSAPNTYTGATAVNRGGLTLNYANMGSTPNLISSSSALQLGGGTLNLVGNVGTSQTFASTAINLGNSVIAVGQTNANNPTLNLAAITPAVGGVVTFYGSAYSNGATTSTGQAGAAGNATTAGQMTATGIINTTSGTANTVLLGTGTGAAAQAAYATVGLYDFAAVSGGSIVGFSQLSTTTSALGTGNDGSYYLETGGTDVNNTEAPTHFDDIAGSFTTSANTTGIGGYRFNENAAITLTVHSAAVFTTGGILVTPNVGAFNDTIAGNGFQPGFRSSANAGSIAVWQNNTQGFLIISAPFANGKVAGGSIVQAGLGTVEYTVANSYSGATYLDGGYTYVNSSITNGDAAFGAAATAAQLNINGGTVVGGISFALDNAGANPRPITLGSNGGGLAAVAGTTLSVDGAIGGSGALMVGIPSSSANGNTSGQLPGTGAGTANSAVLATGTVLLNGPGNFYTGGTVISGGATLNINSVYQLGGAVYGGLTFNGGTLQYNSTLSNTSTDITLNTAATPVVQNVTLTGNGTIDTNGHAITYANSIGNGGAGSLTVASTAAGGSLTLNGNNTFTGAVTVASGALAIGGANVYTGPTAVNAGTFTLNTTAASLGNTAITVANSATFAAKPGVTGGNIAIGTTGASLTLNSGSNFSVADGNVDQLTLNSVGSGTANTVLSLNGANLSFDVGATGASELTANDGKFTSGGTNNISVVALGTTVPSSLTNIPLLSVPNASGNVVSSDFNLQTTAVTFGSTSYIASLSTNAADTTLYLNLAAASLSYYFAGTTSSSFGTASNFVNGPSSATHETSAPGVANDVFLTPNTGTANATNSANISLNGSYTVNSLTFTGTGTVTPATLSPGSGGTLTLQAADSFSDSDTSNSYGAGTGLVVEAGAGADTISANINLGSSQSWEIDSSPLNPLTVSGNIGNSSAGFSLTKTGIGKLILSGSNSYTGGTSVAAGILQLGTGAPNSLPSNAQLTVSGGTFDVNGNSVTVSSVSDGGLSTGVLTDSHGGTILTVNNTVPTTYSGSITGGLAINYGGSSAWTVSGSNTYTGLTTVNSGTVIAASNQPFGNPTAATGGLAMTGPAVVNFTSSTPAIASLSSASSTTSVVLGSSAVAGGTPTTLTVNTVGASPQSFSGAISDLSLAAPAALGSLALSGNGSLTLSNANTFFGTTSIGGTSTLVLGNSLALQNSTLNYNNPTGTLSFGSQTAATLGGLSGNQNLALLGTGGAVTLTVGNNNTSPTYSGGLTGAGSLAKIGSGTQTLSGSNAYTGTTTVSAGTLNVTGSLGSATTPTGAITTQTGGTLAVAGGSVYAPSLTLAHGTGEYSYVTLSGNGILNISGDANINYGSSEGSATSQLNLLSGTASFNSLEAGRSGDTTITAIETSTPVNDDIYVDGAAVTINTQLLVGAGSVTNSTAIYHQDLGTVTVGGTTIIANSNGGRYSVLDVNGGTFTSNDTTGTGIQIGGVFNTVDAELLVRGTAVVTANTITFGDAAQTAGTNVLELLGGLLYVGAGGIVESTAAVFPVTPTINFGGTAYATAPILAATASWTSSLNMTLTNSSSGLAPVIQASNAAGGALSIGLSGLLSGTGGLNVSGTGVVTLAPAGGSNTYTGLSNVSSGKLVFANSGAFPSGTALAIYPGGTAVDETNSVLGTASSIDVNGNLIIQGGASLATVTAEVKTAFNNGAWNGSGPSIIGSSYAASDTTHLHALGVIRNDNGTNTGTPLYSSSTKLFEGFDETDGGSNNPDTDILVKYTYYGDANLDGKVDGSDYSRIDSSYVMEQTSHTSVSGWFNGDFNYDGVVNGSDYTLIDNAFNTQGAQLSDELATPTYLIAGGTLGVSSVPEPTTLGLLGIGAAGLLGRRRRYR